MQSQKRSLQSSLFFETETPARISGEPDDIVSKMSGPDVAEGQSQMVLVSETIVSLLHAESEASLQLRVSLFFEADTAASDSSEPDDSVSETSESDVAEGQSETLQIHYRDHNQFITCRVRSESCKVLFSLKQKHLLESPVNQMTLSPKCQDQTSLRVSQRSY